MQYFRVSNLKECQFYNDRRPDWIKLRGSVVSGYKFGVLPDATKAHVIQLWLLANRTASCDNSFPYNAVLIGDRINATEKVDLDLLVERGFIEIIKE